MNQLIESEPMFHHQTDEWFGTRYFFEHKTFWKKSVLEIILYKEGEGAYYRYVSCRGFRFTSESGDELDYRKESLPFWVRKLFFQFRFSH